VAKTRQIGTLLALKMGLKSAQKELFWWQKQVEKVGGAPPLQNA
jgi:hypothetical protein